MMASGVVGPQLGAPDRQAQSPWHGSQMRVTRGDRRTSNAATWWRLRFVVAQRTRLRANLETDPNQLSSRTVAATAPPAKRHA